MSTNINKAKADIHDCACQLGWKVMSCGGYLILLDQKGKFVRESTFDEKSLKNTLCFLQQEIGKWQRLTDEGNMLRP